MHNIYAEVICQHSIAKTDLSVICFFDILSSLHPAEVISFTVSRLAFLAIDASCRC